ncbi:MAG: S4 domain-containing protein [Candidatus Scalindua sp.]
MNWWSTEKPCQRASNSEIRRWFAKGSILINGERPTVDTEIPYGKVRSLVVHPKSKKGRITIF